MAGCRIRWLFLLSRISQNLQGLLPRSVIVNYDHDLSTGKKQCVKSVKSVKSPLVMREVDTCYSSLYPLDSLVSRKELCGLMGAAGRQVCVRGGKGGSLRSDARGPEGNGHGIWIQIVCI